ncbi:UDP-N-acetylmuramoyl-L-alanyl-D-glutamate--2,6-diaminopimelate ligase [Patescibacteria group bacterium]
MKLKKLVERLEYKKITGSGNIEISGVSDDSRKLENDTLFVAIRGLTVDAHYFVDSAIRNGATVVVGEKKPKKKWLDKITYIEVDNSRKALSQLASAWYDYPSDNLKMVGVTGTDGKTTTSNIIYHILQKNKKKVGLITTINARVGRQEISTGLHVTNPEPLELQRLLSKLVSEGADCAVLEVTSHGLNQERVAGIDFDIAVLTNITHEHLDYHGSWEHYFDSKMKLFKNAKAVVLNTDDKSYKKVMNIIKPKISVSYSIRSKNADLIANDVTSKESGQAFEIVFKGQTYKGGTNMIGSYNLSNILAAIGTSVLMGVDIEEAIKVVSKIPQLDGRMEEIENDKGIRIVVDFAHTPNSLKTVLTQLKKTTKGNLIAVFGCAGERDVEKRKLMPGISVKIADFSIFTTEDPRSEKHEDILEVMAKSISGVKSAKYEIVPDRGKAIFRAINDFAKSGDTIAILGKGHEKSMCYGNIEYPWSDQDAVQDALRGEVKTIKR